MDLQRITQPLIAAETADIAFGTYQEFMQENGFTHGYMGRMPSGQNTPASEDQFFFEFGITDFVKRYIEERMASVDPVVRYVAENRRPFRWRDARKNLTDLQKEQVKIADSYGFGFGLTFPLFHRPGLPGIVSIGRAKDFEITEAETILYELLGRLTFERIEACLGVKTRLTDIVLSTREREILGLVSQGKTNWEIGQILNISEYSVRDYLKSLSTNFGTSNRTHTVVRAIQLGLILP